MSPGPVLLMSGSEAGEPSAKDGPQRKHVGVGGAAGCGIRLFIRIPASGSHAPGSVGVSAWEKLHPVRGEVGGTASPSRVPSSSGGMRAASAHVTGIPVCWPRGPRALRAPLRAEGSSRRRKQPQSTRGSETGAWRLTGRWGGGGDLPRERVGPGQGSAPQRPDPLSGREGSLKVSCAPRRVALGRVMCDSGFSASSHPKRSAPCQAPALTLAVCTGRHTATVLAASGAPWVTRQAKQRWLISLHYKGGVM